MPFGAGIGVRNIAETNMACAAPEGSLKTVLAFNLTVSLLRLGCLLWYNQLFS
jgi:hypothetical protein